MTTLQWKGPYSRILANHDRVLHHALNCFNFDKGRWGQQLWQRAAICGQPGIHGECCQCQDPCPPHPPSQPGPLLLLCCSLFLKSMMMLHLSCSCLCPQACCLPTWMSLGKNGSGRRSEGRLASGGFFSLAAHVGGLGARIILLRRRLKASK